MRKKTHHEHDLICFDCGNRIDVDLGGFLSLDVILYVPCYRQPTIIWDLLYCRVCRKELESGGIVGNDTGIQLRFRQQDKFGVPMGAWETCCICKGPIVWRTGAHMIFYDGSRKYYESLFACDVCVEKYRLTDLSFPQHK